MSHFELKSKCLLDFDFHPETLAVKAVLIALIEAAHRLIALEQILVRATPCVMNAHRVVSCDGTVDEAIARSAPVLLLQPFEHPVCVPEVQHLAADADKIQFPNRGEHGASLSNC